MKTKSIDLAPIFACYGLPRPEQEYRFSPPRRFAFDFAWPAIRLAVEKEGGIYGRAGKGKECPLCGRKAPGAHTSVERLLSDMEKYNLAAELGWRLLRFRPEHFKSGEAFVATKKAFDTLQKNQ